MTFAAGRTVLRRFWRAGQIVWVNPTRVISDDERGLLLLQPVGGAYWRMTTADGRTHHDVEMGREAMELTRHSWTGSDILILIRPGVAHAVYWFWQPDGAFRSWYVNLEDPGVRFDDGETAGVDSADHALDMWAYPGGGWEWKDLDEFAERTGNPLYWDDAGAAAIRAEGERVVPQIESGTFPFDGTWCDFVRDPAWPVTLDLPPGWDRPRAG